MSRHQIKTPPGLYLDGWKQTGSVNVTTGTKPPKLRFQPGDTMLYEGIPYKVVLAYRLKDSPHEWIYRLEETRTNSISRAIENLGAGSKTPRVVIPCFDSSWDACRFFADIPMHADQVHVSNGKLVKHLQETGQEVPGLKKSKKPRKGQGKRFPK